MERSRAGHRVARDTPDPVGTRQQLAAVDAGAGSLGPGGWRQVMVDVLVTGGAGFIGSNFVRHALHVHPDWRITTLDKLTYAGRMETLHDVIDNPRHRFVRGDVADAAVAAPLVSESEIVVHFAAETHVDRSILEAGEFIKTDVIGTFVLLEAARAAKRAPPVRPDLDRRGVRQRCRRARASKPTSCGRGIRIRPARPAPIGWPTATGPPTSVPVIITRASNNYGPVPVPGKSHPALHHQRARSRIRCRSTARGSTSATGCTSWITAAASMSSSNTAGQATCTTSGAATRSGTSTSRTCCFVWPIAPKRSSGRVQDRQGHDKRYSLDTTKLRALGWQPQVPFEQGLTDTVRWYSDNQWWWRPIKEEDPAFRAYYQTQYGSRP